MASILLFAGSFVFGSGCTRTVKVSDPHDHVASADQAEWKRYTRILQRYDLKRYRGLVSPMFSISSPNGEFTLLIAEARLFGWHRDYEPTHAFLRNNKTGDVWVSPNRIWPHRSFGDVTWVDNQHVAVDLYVHPHYGVHFVIDALHHRLLDAVHFEQVDPDSEKIQ